MTWLSKSILKNDDVEDWREVDQDKDRWKAMTAAINTLGKSQSQEEGDLHANNYTRKIIDYDFFGVYQVSKLSHSFIYFSFW